MSEELKVSYYIPVDRIPSTQLEEEDFTGNFIKIGGSTFKEIVQGKKRHKTRSLINHETNERIVIVK